MVSTTKEAGAIQRGTALIAGGVLTWAVLGIWGLVLSLKVVAAAFGFAGAVAALLLPPLPLLAVPWYVGMTTGRWLLLALVYGGAIVAFLTAWVGIRLVRESGEA